MFYDNKFIRFINKNRGSIILVIAIIIFGLLIIKVLNNDAKTKYNEAITNDKSNIISNEVDKSKDTITVDTSIDDNIADANYNLIKSFIEYCNNNDIDKAYELLTEECKENIYPSIENFSKNYIEIVFKEKKQVEIQSWVTNRGKYTYLVTYIGDIIATGNSNEKEYQDYITVDYKKQKLNINQYIGRIEKQVTQEINNIKFEIDYVDLYKDYEIYHLKVTNKNNTQIILDNLSSISSTYIETNKETKINCSNYEAGANTFEFNAGVSKNIKLKFIKQYNVNIVDDRLIFSSAILDAEKPEEIKDITIEL